MEGGVGGGQRVRWSGGQHRNLPGSAGRVDDSITLWFRVAEKIKERRWMGCWRVRLIYPAREPGLSRKTTNARR